MAKLIHQSKSSLASLAIEYFLTVQEWQIRAINEGIAATDKGDVVSHEEPLSELKRWGRRVSCVDTTCTQRSQGGREFYRVRQSSCSSTSVSFRVGSSCQRFT